MIRYYPTKRCNYLLVFGLVLFIILFIIVCNNCDEDTSDEFIGLEDDECK